MIMFVSVNGNMADIGLLSRDVKDNPIGTRWDSTFRVFVFDTKLYLTNQTLIEYHNGKGDVL